MRSSIKYPVVGRDAELDEMEAIFRDVSGTRMQTLLIAAEAGGGKSRLIEEFVRRLEGRALTLIGECVGQRQYPLSLAPVRAMLNALVRAFGMVKLTSFVESDDRRELARLLPEFGAAATPADPGRGRAIQFEVLRRLFEKLANSQPLVLVIEDAHWADKATADLLVFLVGRLVDASILLVISYRPESLGVAGALRTLVADVVRRQGVHQLELPRLSRPEVAMQVEHIVGHAPSAALVNLVFQKGAGVPLFTEALIKSGTDSSSTLTGSLRDFLLLAVRELPAATRAVIRALALGGSRTEHGLLARVVKQSDAALADLLRPAVEAGVITAFPDSYGFRHALIGDAVRSDLLAGEAVAIHRDYAAALEQVGADPGALVAIARHWSCADDPSKAVPAAWRAARQPGCAYSEQLAMLEIIQGFWGRTGDPESLLGIDRIRLLELSADAACWAAEAERCVEFVDQGFAEIGTSGSDDRRAALLLQRAMMRQQGLIAGELADLREAIACSAPDSRTQAEALGQMARALYLRNRHCEASPLLYDMRRIAVALDDAEYQLEADIDRAFLLPVGERSEAFEQLLEQAVAVGSARLEILASEAQLQSLCEEGKFKKIASLGSAPFDRTLALGQGRYMGAAVGYHLCRAFLARGKISQASEMCERMAAQDPLPLNLAKVLECRAEIALAWGDVKRVAQCITALRNLPKGPQAAHRRTAVVQRLEADLAVATGEPARAKHIWATIDHGREGAHTWPMLASLGRAAVESNQADIATQLRDAANQVSIADPVEAAYAAMFAAEMSRLNGFDVESWDEAEAAWKALGASVRQAYCMVRNGAATIGSGRRPAGANAIRRAFEIARQTDATVLVTEIENIAARARIRLHEDEGSATIASPHGLTDREVEVLRLVAAGHTNRQIASTLFISPKTASVHVSNILGKLEAPTRNAAAAIAHRLQMVGPL